MNISEVYVEVHEVCICMCTYVCMYTAWVISPFCRRFVVDSRFVYNNIFFTIDDIKNYCSQDLYGYYGYFTCMYVCLHVCVFSFFNAARNYDKACGFHKRKR